MNQVEQAFKPGDYVSFPGLKEGKVTANPLVGELYLVDTNTTLKGVMGIKGDTQRMMFCPNGSIYCHPRFGIMLTMVKKPEGT